METLNEEELREALTGLPSWKIVDGKLVKEWTFKDFVAAIDFVNKVAGVAEHNGHHPDIDIRYNRVALALVTHDAGGVTAKDVAMCAELDRTL